MSDRAAPPRVMVVDDHDLFRTGLVRLLEEEGVQVVAACKTAEEALRTATGAEIDLVLLDLGLPGMSGLDALDRFLDGDRRPHVVMLTAHEREAELIACLAAGADGYLLKDTPPTEIVSAIEATLRGEAPLSPAVAVLLVRRLRDQARREHEEPHDDLTHREVEVLRLVVAGQSNADIAAALFISESTVKHHVAALIEKLGARSRLEAAVKAVRLGLA